jgi:hypothetical protein
MQRFNELRERAKKASLTPEERLEYDELKEGFARSICAAQQILLKPGERARSSFRVAALFKLEVILNGAVQKTATMEVSGGGFSAMFGNSVPSGTRVSFKMLLSTRETISGIAAVGGAERERSGGLYRISFAFAELGTSGAAQLEEALFDAILFRKLTPPTAFLSPPRGPSIARTSDPELKRASSTLASAPSAPLARTPSAPSLQCPPTRASAVRSEATKNAEERGRLARVEALPDAPGRDRVQKVDHLLDVALDEMRGASAAALREEVPIARAPTPDDSIARSVPREEAELAAAAGPFRAPRPTPFSLVAPSEPEPPQQAARRTPGRLARGSSRALVAAAVAGLAMTTSLAVKHAHRSRDAGRGGAAAAAIPAPVAGSIPAPVAAADRSPPPPASATSPSPVPPLPAKGESTSPATPPPATSPPTEGTIRVALAGHRVFIDGRLGGEGRETIRLSCGAHTVRIGSAGATRRVVVPCGGEIVVGGR